MKVTTFFGVAILALSCSQVTAHEPAATTLLAKRGFEPEATTILAKRGLLPVPTGILKRSVTHHATTTRHGKRGYWRPRHTHLAKRLLSKVTDVVAGDEDSKEPSKVHQHHQEHHHNNYHNHHPHTTQLGKRSMATPHHTTMLGKRALATPHHTTVLNHRRSQPTQTLAARAHTTLMYAPSETIHAPKMESEKDDLDEMAEDVTDEAGNIFDERDWEWVEERVDEAPKMVKERIAAPEKQQKQDDIVDLAAKGRDFSFLKRRTVEAAPILESNARNVFQKRDQVPYSSDRGSHGAKGHRYSSRSCVGPRGTPVDVSPARTYRTPRNHPKAQIGDYEALGADAAQCTTYEDRFSMYTDEALDISYRRDHNLRAYSSLLGPEKPLGMGNGEWERKLRADLRRSNDRAEYLGDDSFPDWRELMDSCRDHRHGAYRRTHREQNDDGFREQHHRVDEDLFDRPSHQGKGTAAVIRSYEGYVWREDDIINLRALIAEVNLNNAEPWDVRILVEVHNRNQAIHTSPHDRHTFLLDNVPREFWGLVEFWSVPEMCDYYPGLPGQFINNMIAQESYRSCFMALQKFNNDHNYEYIWNLEHDVRYLGNWLELFEGTSKWAREEPTDTTMDKYKNWFIPEHPESRKQWADDKSKKAGRGEEADLVSLGPIFDPRESGWFWEHDVPQEVYPDGRTMVRRASIGTNMRLSRNILDAMNLVNAEHKQTLHCEGYPETLVLHSGMPLGHNQSFYEDVEQWGLKMPMKGVFVPHPVYLHHEWDVESLHLHMNQPDFYEPRFENAMRDSSFYYHGVHSKEVYAKWRSDSDACRAPALLHPVKRVD